MKLTYGIELAPMGHRFTTPVQVLFNASKVSEGFNIKKEVTSDLLSCLAPQVGLTLYYSAISIFPLITDIQ